MGNRSDTRRSVEVELIQSERVVERGHRQTVWFVRKSDVWAHATEWPRAVSTSVDPGPGTTWETRVVVALEPGARLMRVVSSPDPSRRLSPLEYLRRDVRAPARRVRRSYFRVGRRGELVRDSGSPVGPAGPDPAARLGPPKP